MSKLFLNEVEHTEFKRFLIMMLILGSMTFAFSIAALLIVWNII